MKCIIKYAILALFVIFLVGTVSATLAPYKPHFMEILGVGPQYAMWTDDGGAEYYVLHIKRIGDEKWIDIKTNNNYYFVSNKVWRKLKDGTYQWYISGFYGLGHVKKDSAASAFVKHTIPPPNTISPKDGEVFGYLPAQLGWGKVLYADSYRISYIMPNGKEWYIIRPTNNYLIPFLLWQKMPPGTYYWKVAAMHDSVVYDYTDLHYFVKT